MSRFIVLCAMALFGALAPAAAAQATASANDQNLTADELVVNAKSLYLQRKYAEAAALYQTFIADYGEAPAAQEAVRQMRYPLAMSLLQMRKFADAGDAIDAALGSIPPINAAFRQELLFWKGVCEMEGKEYSMARESFGQFAAQFPAAAEQNPNFVREFPAIQKLPEARLMAATCLLLDEKFLEAAEDFAQAGPVLAPVNRGRATVLELYALIQAEENDRALELVMMEFPQMENLLQLVTFQTLTLELGSRYLEKKDFRKAIAALQRVWSAERLLKHQQDRLAGLESKLQAAEANPAGDPYLTFLNAQMITKVRREIEGFRRIEHFDSALRLRLATAYQGMKRYRESALILEAMLNEMAPDKIVESASVNLMQCWNAIERWPKAVAAAQAFVEKFPRSGSVPLVLYLQGIAEQRDFQYAAAVSTFDSVVRKYPKSDFAARAAFMKGFVLLQAESNEEAVSVFEEFPRRFPGHPLAEAAAYWRGMGYSFDKQFEACRKAMDDYLAAYKDGAHTGGAEFRKGYAAHSLRNYAVSIPELQAYVRKHPGHEETSEAFLLLGDALLSCGEFDRGIAFYGRVPEEDVRFFEEAWFKTGKAYKAAERFEAMREHFVMFQNKRPKSPRVAEAVYWIGFTHRQADEPEKARNAYWNAITAYGDDPEIRSVDELIPALARLYKGPEEQAQLAAEFGGLAEGAASGGKKVLSLRARWGQACALRRSDPEKSRRLLSEAAAEANVAQINPLLLADFAEALQAAGRDKEADQMWRDLLKWNPRAPQKDRALAALALRELDLGNAKAALDYFNRFDREVFGSFLTGRVMLARAKLLEERGENAGARKSLETLLAAKTSSGPEKSEALYRIGEIHMKEGRPQLAVPYFQRIYVMHGRWRDWVAKAYFRSGEAFEKLHDAEAARRTYQELAENPDMSEFREAGRARDRLNALGGPLPKPEPAPIQG